MALEFGEIDGRAVLGCTHPSWGGDFVGDKCCPDRRATGKFSPGRQ